MTRRQRIVLAMRARRFDNAIDRTTDAQWDRIMAAGGVHLTPRGCYEAMDEPDVTDVAPRIITGGNSGMLCA